MLENLFAQKQRELNQQKQKLEADKAKLDEQIATIDRELAAIDAYEAVRQGKTPTVPTKTKTTRKRRSGVRDDVLAAIKKHPEGISRQALMDVLGATGDKKKETSVSNAVANLKKAGDIEGEQGHYTVTTASA